jgi:hypothetical protein
MNRDDEDRILHGLYFYRQGIDEEVSLSGEQVLWLAMHPLRDGETWSKEDVPQSFDTSVVPDEIVTFAGADRAIRLHTGRGRMDLWYREHKDGILGLATTVIVSFVTALIAVLLTR